MATITSASSAEIRSASILSLALSLEPMDTTLGILCRKIKDLHTSALISSISPMFMPHNVRLDSDSVQNMAIIMSHRKNRNVNSHESADPTVMAVATPVVIIAMLVPSGRASGCMSSANEPKHFTYTVRTTDKTTTDKYQCSTNFSSDAEIVSPTMSCATPTTKKMMTVTAARWISKRGLPCLIMYVVTCKPTALPSLGTKTKKIKSEFASIPASAPSAPFMGAGLAQ
mmetsp:Transcript_37312/g.107528  ORF Transcript_37312/g.107528 Transcript_37312/m.107528 type:complete len:228 (+) Transcript_37312:644-1327(+)